MLHTLPSEVLSLIVFHLCQPEPAQDYVWRIPPVDLICTTKSMGAIAPAINPELYARIFRANFDVRSVYRRIGGVNQRKIRAREVLAELRLRVELLRRLSKMDINVREEDLWTVYIMLLENDGKNIQHLLHPTAPFPLHDLVQLYTNNVMMPMALQPGFPPEANAQALVVWIAWLVSRHRPVPESVQQKVRRMYNLRPYVFASHAYTLFFAPWTIRDLPTGVSREDGPVEYPFVADARPKQRGVEIEWYGRRITVSPPHIAQAAILGFFDRTEEEEETSDSDDEEVPRRKDLLSSNLHDRDFLRLLKCNDPIEGQGLSKKSWKGSFQGYWEGVFSFFEFEAFAEMLAGHKRALYEGPHGEQAQVWRLVETFVRPRRVVVAANVSVAQDDEDEELHIDSGASSNRTKWPLRGPSTNAGFPDVPSIRASLASAQAEERTLKATLKQQVDALEGYEVVAEDELDALLENPNEEGGLELLLTGTGHSAWGSFILKGRVRTWDGMASLVKEYAPDDRGKWIYRGYIVAGDTFVGRWRDTYTPEEFVGYEGSFVLTRR